MKQPFHVYDAALGLVSALRPVLDQVKAQDRALADQMRRAASSVALNFIAHLLCATLRAVASRRWPSAPAAGSPKATAGRGRTGSNSSGLPLGAPPKFALRWT